MSSGRRAVLLASDIFFFSAATMMSLSTTYTVRFELVQTSPHEMTRRYANERENTDDTRIDLYMYVLYKSVVCIIMYTEMLV